MSELGWHFLADKNGKPVYRDGGGTPCVGDVRTHHGPLKLCESGLHFSRRPIDALTYAPGPWLCRVRVDGEVVYETDKGIARRREILWLADITPILRVFARHCAATVLHLWEPPAPEIVWRFIETGDESIRAAAWAAARDAAWDAARDAAWAAAWAAARDAAWAAAWAAAWDAARDAARDAAWAAAWDAQNKMLENALLIALDGAELEGGG
jgi:hypothetical protein